MTDLLSRPLLRVQSRTREPQRPLSLSLALVSLTVSVVGLMGCMVLVVAAWFASDAGSFGQAARIGGYAWLMANGSGLQTEAYTIGVLPLGSMLLVGVFLERGARRAAAGVDPGGREGLRAVLVMGLTYGAALGLGVLLVENGSAQVSELRTVSLGVAFAVCCGGLGVLRGSDLGHRLLTALPDEVRAVATGGLAGVLVLVASGSLALTVSLVVHFPQATRLAEGLEAGMVGGLMIAVVGMCLLPNAALCAGAFLAGPGFALGGGTTVAPGSVELGALPALPLLAALPRHADGWWVDVVAVVPVLAGVAAGGLALLRYPVFSLDRAALRGGLAGAAGGLGFGGLCWLATGSVGPGRMQVVGPDTVPVLAVCVLAGLVGGAVSGFGARWLQGAGPDGVPRR